MLQTYKLGFIIFCAAVSGLLFGYDAGIISGAMLFIKQAFPLKDYQVGLIVGAVPFGALLSAVCIGKITDIIGRRKMLLITALLFIIGSLVCGLAPDILSLIIGRLLLGFAVGMSSTSAPLYIAELAPKERRGRLVTWFLISVNAGIFVSYLVDYVFAYSSQWRYMLGSSAIPACLLLYCALYLPESPRWLILKNYSEQALNILQRLHGKLSAQTEFTEIQTIIAKEQTKTFSFWQLRVLKVLALGALVSIFTQAVGINAIIYYAPTIFQKTGFNQAVTSILATLGIGLLVTLAAICASFYLDKVGRRKLLLSGLAGIIISLVCIVYAFAYIQDQQLLGWIVLSASLFFVACQGLSVGPACFLLPTEIFPVAMRGTGVGISIAFNWLTNTLVAFLFPIVLNYQGTSRTFCLFLILSCVGWVIFYFFVPETKGVSLEAIEKNILSGKPLHQLGEL